MNEASTDSTGEVCCCDAPDLLDAGPVAVRFLFWAAMGMIVRANHPAGFIRIG
jgi:hypothetical protein